MISTHLSEFSSVSFNSKPGLSNNIKLESKLFKMHLTNNHVNDESVNDTKIKHEYANQLDQTTKESNGLDLPAQEGNTPQVVSTSKKVVDIVANNIEQYLSQLKQNGSLHATSLINGQESTSVMYMSSIALNQFLNSQNVVSYTPGSQTSSVTNTHDVENGSFNKIVEVPKNNGIQTRYFSEPMKLSSANFVKEGLKTERATKALEQSGVVSKSNLSKESSKHSSKNVTFVFADKQIKLFVRDYGASNSEVFEAVNSLLEMLPERKMINKIIVNGNEYSEGTK